MDCDINCKKYALASVAAFVAIFIFDWVFHGVFLKASYEATSSLWRMQGDSMMSLLTFGQLSYAFVFGYIFLKNYEAKGITEGLRFGVLIGLLFLPYHLIMHAVAPYPMNLTVSWIIGEFVRSMLAGSVFAALYKA